MRILVHYPFSPEQVDGLQDVAKKHGHELLLANDEDEAVAMVAGCQVLMGYFTQKVTSAGHDLRWVQSFSAGMDNYLYPEIVDRELVVVSNTAGLYAPQGGEHAWALLLALTRGLRPAIQNMHEAMWGGGDVIELTGMTLGIIGLGGFGRETAKRSRGYDMKVLGLDPVQQGPLPDIDEVRSPDADSLDWLLCASDAVVIACPRTPATYHLISSPELVRMKQTAYLVCVSRGGIVDEPALVAALQGGEIAGAGLDVCEVEPVPAESPLWQTPNLILTPHRAGASQHRPRKIYEFFCDNLDRYLRGESPSNIVDKAAGF
ncbi:MAG: D-2-hydroxyacid dehydrogenase [Gemmatimonadetes bacterium]|jgi:phosphoglycerate dehydrogenase-like enzyme|nr:D-2-hydroxyacid dehydrogenase [Gemmatimonadota bacterium]MBT7861521.1 D-2-hydroxyacid dehydrogenase [Gemmatimonadota bacterium]